MTVYPVFCVGYFTESVNVLSCFISAYCFFLLSVVFCLSVCCMPWLPYGVINDDGRTDQRWQSPAAVRVKPVTW